MSPQVPPAKRPPRRGTLAARVELGMAAFSPAFAFMALRLSWDAPLLAISWGAAAVVGFVSASGIAAVVRTASAEPYEFDAIEDAGPEVVGHVTTYIIPMVVDPHGAGAQMIVASLALLLVVWIHITTGRVLVNPLLYLVGRRAYAATTVQGPSYFLVARSDPGVWTGTTFCRSVGSAILVESPPRSQRRLTEENIS